MTLQVKHRFTTVVPDGPDNTLVRPSNWNDTHSVVQVPTVVTSGLTYASVVTDTLIIVQKTVGSATTINLLASELYSVGLIIKDGKGDAATNTVTVVPFGTERIDGQASVPLSGNFGAMEISPNPLGGWVILNYG